MNGLKSLTCVFVGFCAILNQAHGQQPNANKPREVALLLDVKGEVFVLRAAQNLKAHDGLPVFVGDRLISINGGQATLYFHRQADTIKRERLKAAKTITVGKDACSPAAAVEAIRTPKPKGIAPPPKGREGSGIIGSLHRLYRQSPDDWIQVRNALVGYCSKVENSRQRDAVTLLTILAKQHDDAASRTFAARFEASGREGKRVALLVGVNKYDRRGFRDLKYAERDVQELAKVLQPAGYQIHLLTGERATLNNVQRAVETLLKDRTKQDLLLVALAGHGFQTQGDARQSESFFCPVDATQGKPDSMLAMGPLFSDINRRGGGQNLVLVDACRDDPKMGRGMDGSTVKTLPADVAVLFGCQAGKKTFEANQLAHGVFFHYVLEGLRGGAKNSRGEVTWSRLAEYVSEKVPEQSARLVGERQTPNEIKNIRGRSPVLIPLESSPPKQPVVSGQGSYGLDLAAAQLGALPKGWSGDNMVAVASWHGTRVLKSSSRDLQTARVEKLDVRGDFALNAEIDGSGGLDVLLGDAAGKRLKLAFNGSGATHGFHWSIAAPGIGKKVTVKGGPHTTLLSVRREGQVFQVAVNGAVAATFREAEFDSLESIGLGFHNSDIGVTRLAARAMAPPPGRSMKAIRWTSREPGMWKCWPSDKLTRCQWSGVDIHGDFNASFTCTTGGGRIELHLLGAQGGLDFPIELTCRGPAYSNTWMTRIGNASGERRGTQREREVTFELQRRGEVIRLLSAGKLLTSIRDDAKLFRGFGGLVLDIDNPKVMMKSLEFRPHNAPD